MDSNHVCYTSIQPPTSSTSGTMLAVLVNTRNVQAVWKLLYAPHTIPETLESYILPKAWMMYHT